MRSVSRLLVAPQAALFLLVAATAAGADNVMPGEGGEDFKPPTENAQISGTYQCRQKKGQCDFASDFITSVCALIVVKDSKIVFRKFVSCKDEEGNAIDSGPDTQFGLASIAKSITSTLIGLARTDPQYGPFNLDAAMVTIEARFSEVPGSLKFRDALRMRGGLVEDDFGPSKLKKHAIDKKSKTFLQAINAFAKSDESAEVGETFLYSNMTAAILGTALEAWLRKKGPPHGPKTLDKALEQWIWHPFKMGGSARWKADKAGSPSPYCCFYMRADDLAKFGEFVLRQLKSPGARLQKWLIDASAYEGGPVRPPCFSQGEPFLLGYGYQWWVFENSDLGFTGIGTGGQFLHIIPKSNMVIVQLSSAKGDFEDFKCDSFSAHKLIQEFLDKQ